MRCCTVNQRSGKRDFKTFERVDLGSLNIKPVFGFHSELPTVCMSDGNTPELECLCEYRIGKQRFISLSGTRICQSQETVQIRLLLYNKSVQLQKRIGRKTVSRKGAGQHGSLYTRAFFAFNKARVSRCLIIQRAEV